MAGSTDRIEKQVHLRAPRERVWQALSDSSRFGTWFGVDFDGPFVEGERLTGRITPTKVDPEVAAMQKPHEGTPFEWRIEKIVPIETLTSMLDDPSSGSNSSTYFPHLYCGGICRISSFSSLAIAQRCPP